MDQELSREVKTSNVSQPRRKTKSKKMETGTIEKGSKSDQTFQTVDKKFYSYTTATVEFQIKPVSQMRMTAKQAVNSSKYCTNCGKKANYKHKFCANCGSKL
jgi:rRNA maturation endonuclease Nob1